MTAVTFWREARGSNEGKGVAVKCKQNGSWGNNARTSNIFDTFKGSFILCMP